MNVEREPEGLPLLWCDVCQHFFGGERNEHGFLVFRCSGCGLVAYQLPLGCDVCPVCGMPTPAEDELGRHLVDVHGNEGERCGGGEHRTTEVTR